jgi:uncharacterized spore protein YtfJ
MGTFSKKEENIMIEEAKAKAPVADPVAQVLGRITNTARVDAVFGQPVERGDTTVIPCSEIAIGVGLGSGSGPVDAQGNQTGGGSGGGGGARGRPIAAIVITRDGVRVEPILDLTKIALAAFTTGAFILFWIGRLSGISRGDKGPSFSQFKRTIEG